MAARGTTDTPTRRQAPTGQQKSRRERAAASREGRPGDRGPRDGGPSLSERLIAGVPARIMRPRLIFLACVGALTLFGLLMVYSASSVEALHEQGSAAYYLLRQVAFVGIGTIGAILVANIPLRLYVDPSRLLSALWVGIVLALLAVRVMGTGANGATRWIYIGFFGFQPSEFAKPLLVVAAADIFAKYYDERSIDLNRLAFSLLAGILVPLLLILIQPDFGTTVIIGASVVAISYFAGVSGKLLLGCALAVAAIGAVLVVMEPYRMTRIEVMLDPWKDPFKDGYQATLAIMAFASGGLFGRGIGNATMKYSYLPEAHNDYILAIIGEELGFVGTTLFFAVFVAMLWSAYRIASRSPTPRGRYIGYGCTVLFAVQFLINALGILGAIPMTGKPLPFISYGGSSIISCLAIAGLLVRVSLESNVATVHDLRRRSLSVVGEGRGSGVVGDGAGADGAGGAAMGASDDVSSHLGRSTAGSVHVRHGSGAGAAGFRGAGAAGSSAPSGAGASPARRGFGVMPGGAASGRARQVRRGGSAPLAGRSVPLAGGRPQTSGYQRDDGGRGASGGSGSGSGRADGSRGDNRYGR